MMFGCLDEIRTWFPNFVQVISTPDLQMTTEPDVWMMSRSYQNWTSTCLPDYVQNTSGLDLALSTFLLMCTKANTQRSYSQFYVQIFNPLKLIQWKRSSGETICLFQKKFCWECVLYSPPPSAQVSGGNFVLRYFITPKIKHVQTAEVERGLCGREWAEQLADHFLCFIFWNKENCCNPIFPQRLTVEILCL